MIDWQAIYEKHQDDVPPDETLECEECGHHIKEGEAYYEFDGWTSLMRITLRNLEEVEHCVEGVCGAEQSRCLGGRRELVLG